jgi:glyoxylase-like metal-dependent hydrolase (beta-lactamase superfamily II)
MQSNAWRILVFCIHFRKENCMLYPPSPLFNRLHAAIQKLPVIDCHEHMAGPSHRPPYTEPIACLTPGYVQSDLLSAAKGLGIAWVEVNKLWDPAIATDEKWPAFERLWQATQHTAYARVTRLVLQNVYGQSALTRDSLERVREQLSARTDGWYDQVFDEAGIQAVLIDSLGRWFSPNILADYLSGKVKFPPRFHPFLPLPDFHPTRFNDAIPWVESLVDVAITSLDEFMEAVYEVFERGIERGAVGLKDQSAYDRNLAYELPTTAEAEKLFNHLLADPRNALGWPESKPLNDYLFHQYKRFARELDLPVQVHTGHMAGTYNRVDKANAALLASALELHKEVRFDLFHGNWPYLDDYLFLGKNYPNVALDLCWLHIIDPGYADELLTRAVLAIPHSKLHAFGGDYFDVPEFAAAHLQVAREVVAGALAKLVERGWLEEARRCRSPRTGCSITPTASLSWVWMRSKPKGVSMNIPSPRSYDVISIGEKTWRIDEFGLDACYLLEGADQALLIDTGSGIGDLKGLVETLTPLPYEVVATHGHMDHMGGKGQFETVHLHPSDFTLARSSTLDQRKGYASTMMKTYPHLQPLIDLDAVEEGKEPALIPIQVGFRFDLGDRPVEVFETPGHTPGSICLLDSRSRILFSGDSFNPIFLLIIPGDDRSQVVRAWLSAAERVWSLRSAFDCMYGGHESPLGLEILSDLIACGRGILDGSILPEPTRIHLFDGLFAHYGKVVIAHDPQRFRFVRRRVDAFLLRRPDEMPAGVVQAVLPADAQAHSLSCREG